MEKQENNLDPKEKTQITQITEKTENETQAGVIPVPSAAEETKETKAAEDPEKDIKKRKRNNIIFTIVSVLIIACVISVLVQLSSTLQEGNSATFGEMIANMNGWYLLAVVALFIVGFLLDSLKYTLLNKCNGYKLGFHKDMKVALTGKYYENITPTATGGQPMQIYYLHKQGMPGANSASVTMVKYGVQMLAWTIFAAVVMGCLVGTLSAIEDTVTRTTVYVCGWIGFCINGMIPVVVIFVVFCPRAVAWVANLFVRILHKIHIVKNAEKMQARIRKWMDDFAVFSQFIFRHPVWFLLLFLLCLAEPIIQFIIPYFLLIALCGQYVTAGWELFFTVVGLAMYSTYAAVFIPTPGNSGAVESVFMLAFASIASGVLFWYVLIWRFVLYYSYIVMGIGMNIFDVVVNLRQEKKRRSFQLGNQSQSGNQRKDE